MAKVVEYAGTSGVVVGASETTILEKTGLGLIEDITLHVSNDGSSNAITECKFYIRASSATAFALVESAWTSATNSLIYFEKRLDNLAASASGVVQLNIRGAQAFKLTAKSSSGTTVTVNGLGRGA